MLLFRVALGGGRGQESGRGHSGLVHSWMGLDRIGLAGLDGIG